MEWLVIVFFLQNSLGISWWFTNVGFILCNFVPLVLAGGVNPCHITAKVLWACRFPMSEMYLIYSMVVYGPVVEENGVDHRKGV